MIWSIGLVVVLAIVAVVMYVVGQLQKRLVFRPTAEELGTPARFRLPYEDVWLSTKGARIHGWWIEGGQPTPVFLYLPGAHGNLSFELPTLQYLAGLGVPVFAINYPGYGPTTGSPGESACLAATDSAWRYLTQDRCYGEQQIIVFGRSLGSALAAFLARKYRPKTLVIHSGFTSIRNLAREKYALGPLAWLVRNRLPLQEWIKAIQCPLLLIHSERDEFIPIEHGEALFRDATAPKAMVRVRGSHSSNLWQGSGEIRRFLEECATPGVES